MKPRMMTRRRKIDWSAVWALLAMTVIGFCMGAIFFIRLTDGRLH